MAAAIAAAPFARSFLEVTFVQKHPFYPPAANKTLANRFVEQVNGGICEPLQDSRGQAPPPHLQPTLIGRWAGQSSLLISWHTGEAFLLAQRVQGEGGATNPLRGTAGAWQVYVEGGGVMGGVQS